MTAESWSSLVNLVAAGNSYAGAVAIVAAQDFGTNFGIASTTEMNNEETYISTQASLPWYSRDRWYTPNSPNFIVSQQGGGTVLGPNLIVVDSNGPYPGVVWAQGGIATSQSQNQPDPFGGSTASTLTATMGSSQLVRMYQSTYTLTPGTTYRLSFYGKAGTQNFISITDNTGNYAIFNVSTGAVVATAGNAASATCVAVLNGFFFCGVNVTPTSGPTQLMTFGNSQADAIPGVTWSPAGTETWLISTVALQVVF